MQDLAANTKELKRFTGSGRRRDVRPYSCFVCLIKYEESMYKLLSLQGRPLASSSGGWNSAESELKGSEKSSLLQYKASLL